MFPFKTDIFSFNTRIGGKEIQKKVEDTVLKKEFLEIGSNRNLYGRIRAEYAVYSLGQSPNRNAFVPMVVLKWKDGEEFTKVTSYFRLDFRIILVLLIILIGGGIISYQIGNLIPVVILFLIVIGLLSVFQVFYQRSKQSIITMNNELLHKLKGS